MNKLVNQCNGNLKMMEIIAADHRQVKKVLVTSDHARVLVPLQGMVAAPRNGIHILMSRKSGAKCTTAGSIKLNLTVPPRPHH